MVLCNSPTRTMDNIQEFATTADAQVVCNYLKDNQPTIIAEITKMPMLNIYPFLNIVDIMLFRENKEGFDIMMNIIADNHVFFEHIIRVWEHMYDNVVDDVYPEGIITEEFYSAFNETGVVMLCLYNLRPQSADEIRVLNCHLAHSEDYLQYRIVDDHAKSQLIPFITAMQTVLSRI